MNNNNSKHTPIITLEEIARRKAEKREEVLKAKTQITETLRELFVPEENKGGIEGIMQHVNTGIAVYDGVMTGIKIMRKVRSYFTKKKKQKIYKLTYLLNKSNEKTTTGSGSFYAGIICTCTRQSVVDALLCHFT